MDLLPSLPPPSPPPPPQNVEVSVPKETESPPQKKHKKNGEVEEESGDETSSDFGSLFTDAEYDSAEDYDHDLMDKYWKQVKESEGFDIEDYPGGCFMTTAFPMQNYLTYPNNVVMLKDYAGRALKLYNAENGTSYDVDDILKVNGGGCRDFVFYITFSVKNGVEHFFQAKVVEDLDNHLEFPIVRPKPKATVVVE